MRRGWSRDMASLAQMNCSTRSLSNPVDRLLHIVTVHSLDSPPALHIPYAWCQGTLSSTGSRRRLSPSIAETHSTVCWSLNGRMNAWLVTRPDPRSTRVPGPCIHVLPRAHRSPQGGSHSSGLRRSRGRTGRGTAGLSRSRSLARGRARGGDGLSAPESSRSSAPEPSARRRSLRDHGQSCLRTGRA